MGIYVHYDKKTKEFKGWFMDQVHSKIPEPNIEVTEEEYVKYNEDLTYHAKAQIGKITIELPRLEADYTWDDIRQTRNGLLEKSDWIELPNAPLSEEKKDEWRVYRTALRDVTEKYDHPKKVVWPETP